MHTCVTCYLHWTYEAGKGWGISALTSWWIWVDREPGKSATGTTLMSQRRHLVYTRLANWTCVCEWINDMDGRSSKQQSVRSLQSWMEVEKTRVIRRKRSDARKTAIARMPGSLAQLDVSLPCMDVHQCSWDVDVNMTQNFHKIIVSLFSNQARFIPTYYHNRYRSNDCLSKWECVQQEAKLVWLFGYLGSGKQCSHAAATCT